MHTLCTEVLWQLCNETGRTICLSCEDAGAALVNVLKSIWVGGHSACTQTNKTPTHPRESNHSAWDSSPWLRGTKWLRPVRAGEGAYVSMRESARFTRVWAVDRAGAVIWFARGHESCRFLDTHGEFVVDDRNRSHMVQNTTCLFEWASCMHACE